ncbi:uncharacterized protein E0L32_010674 [Thyridium curvatum]|uniref:NECAP PHear domain-containing protein n=1 Tax=Thyridium curvatum TaxID=1093900 RepID=A0A507AMA5_9PEZI|nr:uncharacterized protein E0L32_010674 [Thyridium curvatum]TPX07676.1 hypothetical protein E0L32_010674 [Thyridium curvatum]
METIDPATGQQLPADAIQRVLYIANKVHVYNIPPLASTRGYTAAAWTEDPKRHIFTVRLRIMETAVPCGGGGGGGGEEDQDEVKTDIVLEDPSTGQLFAAAPYTDPGVVEAALDSSRFFALRVRDPSGRKAVLGIGYEERSEAFDFGVALQEAQKGLGFGPGGAAAAAAAAGGGGPSSRAKAEARAKAEEERRDYSLKEGETITVNLGGKFGRRNRPSQESSSGAESGNLSSFALPPPPSAGPAKGGPFLPPPPSASDVRSKRRSVQELGFDDGQFGEFA